MQYTIQSGDTLSALAQKHGTSVQELQRLNPQISNPDKIYSGRTLNLPGQTSEKTANQNQTAQDQMKIIQERLASLRERMSEPPKIVMPDEQSDITSGQKIIDKVPGEDFWTKEQERLAKEREAAQEERKGLTDKLGDFFTGRQSVEEKLRQERQAAGMPDMLTRYSGIVQDIQQTQQTINNLVEQRAGAVAAIGSQAIATPFITGQQARVAQAYDSRINALSAKMGAEAAHLQATQGEVQLARAMVGDIVDAYTYDSQMELQKITMFLDINRDELEMLGGEYMNALNQQQRLSEMQYEQDRTEREAVLNLMLQYTEAGINYSDNLEDAVQKSAQWTNIQPDANIRELMLEYPTAGITEEDTFAEAITKISTMPPGIPEAPTVFGGQGTGYFTWQYDEASGTWSPTQVVGAPSPAISGTMAGGVTPEEPLSILDVQRLKEMHSGAGITVGDTLETANVKIYLTETLPASIKEGKEQGFSRNEFIENFTQMRGTVPNDAEMGVIDSIYAPTPENAWHAMGGGFTRFGDWTFDQTFGRLGRFVSEKAKDFVNN